MVNQPIAFVRMKTSSVFLEVTSLAIRKINLSWLSLNYTKYMCYIFNIKISVVWVVSYSHLILMYITRHFTILANVLFTTKRLYYLLAAVPMVILIILYIFVEYIHLDYYKLLYTYIYIVCYYNNNYIIIELLMSQINGYIETLTIYILFYYSPCNA